MKKCSEMLKQLLFFMLPVFALAQERSSISSICAHYEEIEYVLLGKSDTTAVIHGANVAEDLGLTNPIEVKSDEDGQYTVFHDNGLRIIFLDLFDGRDVTTISKL